MKSEYQRLSKATVQIFCNQVGEKGDGSGFNFCDEQYIITNDHVIEKARKKSNRIYAVTDEGEEAEVEVVAYSHWDENDYAILRNPSGFSEDRVVLEPATDSVDLGTEVLFAGFPHGIADLLIHSATISGVQSNDDFYLDNSVNPANSGGPIINKQGEVVGIVTYSRFELVDDLYAAVEKINNISDDAEKFDFIYASDVSYGELFDALSDISETLVDLIDQNANTGIGIGKPIEPVKSEVDDLE